MRLPRMHTEGQTNSALAPDEDGIVHTGSISSTVDLDFVHGEAHKVYHPSLPVRLLYRLAFQAPFPYVANHPALEAARLRRRIVDILTKYWFGHHLVARVLDVEDVPGGAHDFVTQLVAGAEPSDLERAREFLRELDRRFMAAGIATWQITPYNPHSVTNLIEKQDGTYRIIDLESSLVAFLYPVSQLVGFIRAGLVPSFDDVDVARLEQYVADQAVGLSALGAEYDELVELVARYRSAQDQWHATEPRIINKALRFLLRLVDVPSWIRGIRRLLDKGEGAAVDQLRAGLDLWVCEGRMTREEADSILASLKTPDVERAVFHIGAHFAISLPLRFPFGAGARFIYTTGLRVRAEIAALLRRGDAAAARRLHTVPVALLALLPGFGRLAYFLSPALSSQPLLVAVPLDHVSRKLPLRLYERLHLDAVFVYLGRRSQYALRGQQRLRDVPAAIARRHALLRPHWGLIAAVLAVNGAVFTAGAALYLEAGRPDRFWWFDEFGVTQSLEAAQLLIAGFAGIRAYQIFWSARATGRSAADAFGIFLWGIGGIGLIAFAADDLAGLHEFLGRQLLAVGLVPSFLGVPDDILVLGYAVAGVAVLAVFRDELLRARNSTAVLIPAAIASVLMVVADVGGGPLALRALEFPAQTAAVACLTLAFVIRYLEVREGLRAPLQRRATHAVPV